MNLIDIILLALLALATGTAVIFLFRRRKSGCCGSCSGCRGCESNKKICRY